MTTITLESTRLSKRGSFGIRVANSPMHGESGTGRDGVTNRYSVPTRLGADSARAA